MSYYVWGSNLSYADYLQAKSFTDDVSSATREAGDRVVMEMSRSTRAVIASNEALAAKRLVMMQASSNAIAGAVHESMDRATQALGAGFDRISFGIDELSSGLEDLRATFSWKFSQVLAGVGRMNDSLSELIKVAKTPAQTAAYEQYEIARDAFRRSLYSECMESLDKAIAGDHASAGYKLDWRFHHMKGILELGFVGSDLTLMNHTRAEESFLLAARYAKTDYPQHAAQAFLSAGWAAYCQGRLTEALAHTEQAVGMNPLLGEAFFQAAKVHMALGQVHAALPVLGQAIDIDGFFALKAAGDGDFQRHDARLREFLDSMRKEKHQQLLPHVKRMLEQYRSWQEHIKGTRDSAQEKLESFLSNGEAWSLMEVCDVANIVKTSEFVQVRVPGDTMTQEEQYDVQETYQEEVVVKPAGMFRKAVTEMQDRTRMVTKSRSVKKALEGKVVWMKKTRTVAVDDSPAEGEFYYGTVTELHYNCAHVKMSGGVVGLLWRDEVDMTDVRKVEDVLREGDRILVKCIGVHSNGTPMFSRKRALDEYVYGGPVVSTEGDGCPS